MSIFDRILKKREVSRVKTVEPALQTPPIEPPISEQPKKMVVEMRAKYYYGRLFDSTHKTDGQQLMDRIIGLYQNQDNDKYKSELGLEGWSRESIDLFFDMLREKIIGVAKQYYRHDSTSEFADALLNFLERIGGNSQEARLIIEQAFKKK